MTLETFETLLGEVLDETVDLGKRERARFENSLIERMHEEDAFEVVDDFEDSEDLENDVADEDD